MGSWSISPRADPKTESGHRSSGVQAPSPNSRPALCSRSRRAGRVRRLGWPEVGKGVRPAGRPPRDHRHLSALVVAPPLKIREGSADHRRQSRGLTSRITVGRNFMERLKIGSAFLLVALAGCGGGGGGPDAGLDVRQDVRVDQRIDTAPGTDVSMGTDGPTGFDIPAPTCTDRVLNRKRDRCRLRRRLPGLSGGHDLHDAGRLPDEDVRGRQVRRRQLHQRHHGHHGDRRRLRRWLSGLLHRQGLPRLHRLRQLRVPGGKVRGADLHRHHQEPGRVRRRLRRVRLREVRRRQDVRGCDRLHRQAAATRAAARRVAT